MYIGSDDAGYLQIGDEVDLAHFGDNAGYLNNLNINSMFYISHREPKTSTNTSNVSFMFSDNKKALLTIPFKAAGHATSSSNSLIIDSTDNFNEKLYDCGAKNFNKIDCDGDSTGADLGVEDDLQVKGRVYVGDIIMFYGGSQSGIRMFDEAGNRVCMRCWSDGVCNATAGNC